MGVSQTSTDFLWDREIDPDHFRRVVNDSAAAQHDSWLALLLREARPSTVWEWTTPQHVAAHLPVLARRLGRRRDFWIWLFAGWRQLGFLE